jgi:MFS family permease
LAPDAKTGDETSTPEQSVKGSRRGSYTVLRHRDFRLLWQAEFASNLGTQMQRVAIAWQIYQLTGDALQLGLLGLVRFAAILVVGLVGGVLADQRDRRRLLFASQLGLAASSALLALLSATGSASVAAIYAITLASAALAAVGGPARQAFIPSLVPREEIAGAMSLNILAMQVATVSGPVVAGWLIGQISVTPIYAIDGLSFVLVAGAALAIRARPPAAAVTGGALHAALEGLTFLRGSPVLLGVMAADFAATFFGAATVLMPIFASEVLEVGPSGLGFLYAAPAVGAVLGSLAMTLGPIPRRPGRGVLLAIALYGATVVGFGLSRTVWVSLLLLAAGGAADAASMALRHAIRNLVTPDELRGRVAATHSMFAMGGPQLGEFEAGLAARLIGPGPSVALGGLGTIAAATAVALLAPAIRRYRT